MFWSQVQSFFRGWLCRRRWKQIVEEYIHSPHAENMKKRNSLVFRMVEQEEEYVEQLQLLVACFYVHLKWRPAQRRRRALMTMRFIRYAASHIPRYIITLHELLAHTPHNHVERRSLENARKKLEVLSKQMHDEVSETENIRKNLSIERMIIEGCDLLLDVNQVYVRQGSLIQLPSEKSKSWFSKSSDKGGPRQCFLFANHMLLTTRTESGRLHLVSPVGKISLVDATLIEEPNEQTFIEDDSESLGSPPGDGILIQTNQSLDFKLIVDVKNAPSVTIHLIAPSLQEKAAWVSDISHCLDNVHFNNLFHGNGSNSSVTMPTSIRNDPRLFKDDVDIRFSRTLNSCKVPQIRYATPCRLLERLTDLRFLSIDFLNTFLLTYRVFTDGVTVLEALKKVYYNPEVHESPIIGMETGQGDLALSPPEYDSNRRISNCSISSLDPRRVSNCSITSSDPRRISTCSVTSNRDIEPRRVSNCSVASSDTSDWDRGASQHWRMIEETSRQIKLNLSLNENVDSNLLDVPKTSITGTISSDTLTGQATSTHTSTHTLVADDIESERETKTTKKRKQKQKQKREAEAEAEAKQLVTTDTSSGDEIEAAASSSSPEVVGSPPPLSVGATSSYHAGRRSVCSVTSYKRGSSDTSTDSSLMSPRSSMQHSSESPQHSSRAGVVITSNRASQRRSSTSGAAIAFAAATAGSSNPPDYLVSTPRSSLSTQRNSFATPRSSIATPRSSIATPRSSISCRFSIVSVDSSCKALKRESMMYTAATMRVLNVLRHWISKHSQDFESGSQLKQLTIEFLDELVCNNNLLPVEHKAATQLLRLITRDDSNTTAIDLDLLLAPPLTPSKENMESASAIDLAENMTYLDHTIFISIRSEEFLNQGWMKIDKMTRAPNITLMHQRFNNMSKLVVSRIIDEPDLAKRVVIIEKWINVADICRCMHNFNGVLQICSALANAAVFRLKKTWEKVSKTSRQINQKLQTLSSAEGRFRNLREALHRSDPPCIPYLGTYLGDLIFIEEGTPNYTDDGLLNFSKMRMIAHVIREIRHLQQTPYKIDTKPEVIKFLLDQNLIIRAEDVLYEKSLHLEPRQTRLGSISSGSS
uniref:Ras-GEF domain-containing protein n=1 Tax=Strigamia maritima TaxID=126957 RepID=T1IPE1_STRMM